MGLLLASLISFALAPWAYGRLHRWRAVHNLLDTLLILIVAGIVLVEVFWDSFQNIGWVGPLLGIAGLAIPSTIEQAFHKLAIPAHKLTALLGLVALMMHSLMDGATLAVSGNDWLAYAVVLHQLPFGLAVWWLVQHASGSRVAAFILASMSLATIGGYMLTQQILPLLNAATGVTLQAFLAGTLLHVLIHRRKPHHNHS